MTHIGLPRGTVTLSDYNNAWPLIFKNEAMQLQGILNIPLKNIHHVGSTSIPGMRSKPIIDIAILAEDLAIAEKWEPPLRQLGYWYKGLQPDMPDRRFFAKGPEDNRTVYLHIVNRGEFEKLIKFRETLRGDAKLAEQYATLKQELALANANDRANYTRQKNDFIQKVLSQT